MKPNSIYDLLRRLQVPYRNYHYLGEHYLETERVKIKINTKSNSVTIFTSNGVFTAPINQPSLSYLENVLITQEPI